MANMPSPAWMFNIIHLGSDWRPGPYRRPRRDGCAAPDGAPSLADYPYDDTKCPTPLRASAGPRHRTSRSRATRWSGTRRDPKEPRQGQGRARQGPSGGHHRRARCRASSISIRASRSGGRTPEAKPMRAATPSPSSAMTTRPARSSSSTRGTPAGATKGYGRMTYDTFVARVWEGYIMHLPGDPEIALAELDFVADVIERSAARPPPFKPPLIVTPTADDASARLRGAIELGRSRRARLRPRSISAPMPKAIRSPPGFVGTEAELARIHRTRSRARSTTSMSRWRRGRPAK